MPRWTAVTTRIPSKGGRYLVFAPKRGICLTQQHPSWWNHKDKRGREYNGEAVTHWMPVPSAPRTR